MVKQIAILLTILFGFFFCDLWAKDQVSKPSAQGEPDCNTSYVEQLAGPTKRPHYIVITCGKERSAYPIDNYPEREKTRSKPEENPLETWNNPNARRDIIAQESMALSTLWIKCFTGLGLIISAVGLGLLVRNLQVANKTFELTSDATSIEFQPYLSVKLVSCEATRFFRADGNFNPQGTTAGSMIDGCDVRVAIKNNGKTPAIDVYADFDAKKSSLTFKKGKKTIKIAGVDEIRPRWREKLIPNEEELEFQFVFAVQSDENIFPKKDVAGQGCIFQQAILEGLGVRYKDFLSKDRNYHKIASGRISRKANGTRVGVSSDGLFVPEKENDKKHPDYKPSSLSVWLSAHFAPSS